MAKWTDPIEETHRHLVQENQRLTEELAKVREVNADQANRIEALLEQLRHAQQAIAALQLRGAKEFERRMTARSGE